MQGKILDRNAVNFAVPFYDALGAGRDLPFAFALGQHAIARYGKDGREDGAILLQGKPTE
ncbi:MAG: hypothetical protein KDI38_26115 [Calditrichaeota bacterium]|nr:hypothetical protein [Calditrichota bacterium]